MHAHPADLRQILAIRQSPASPLDKSEFGTLHAFVRVCELLEPQLVWPKGDARVRWLTGLSHAKFYLTAWSAVGFQQSGSFPQLEFAVVNELAGLAERYWRAPVAGPIRQFPFLQNAELRSIVERDFASLSAARKADEVKVALVLAGSVIEATLLDVIERDLKASEIAAQQVMQAKGWKKLDPKAASDWKLFQQIALCGPDGLSVLSIKTEKIAQEVRDWRNLVHPGRERDESRQAPLRPSDAAVAEALVEKVLDEVEAWTHKGKPVVPPKI